MIIENLVRKNILNLKPYVCARDMYSEGILLDANENSIGSVAAGYDELTLNRYPDPHQAELRKAVGEYYGVDEKKLFFGVGSDEIIDLLIRIFCEPAKDAVIILDPTYGMYKVACDINNVETISTNLNDEFQIDFDNIQRDYRNNVKLIFACSPNNPTGNLLKKEDVERLCKLYNSIIVIDEAYIDFSGDNSLINEAGELNNLVVLRTFSKAWGLAAIRLGYCIADEVITRLLFNIKAPYTINSLTKKTALEAIQNNSRKDDFIKLLTSERERVKEELLAIPEVPIVYPSDANYLLFQCENATEVQKSMALDGVVIRDRSSHPMLRNCLRVSIGTVEENNKFLTALKKQICRK
ncbi:MAG: histidinol-phosphate transaminase [Ignavibacteria bacterium]